MFIGGIALGVFVLVILELLLLLGLVASERPYSALLSIAVVAAILDLCFGTGVYATLWHHPWTAVAGVLGYIAIGVLWSFPKWWFFVHQVRDRYIDELNGYKLSRGLAPDKILNPDEMAAFKKATHYRWDNQIPPQVSKNKNTVLVWMMYWPFSLLWTLFDEPIQRAFRWIFERIKGVYQRISESVFSDLEV